MRKTKNNGALLYRDRDWLYQKIFIENFTQKQLAKKARCSTSTIEYWINKHDLQRREVDLNFPYDDKELLHRLYHLENLSQKEIADKLGCSEGMIERRIKKYDLVKRVYNEDRPYEDRKKMYNLIVVQNKSYEQVAKELKCSATAVRNWAIRFGFPRVNKRIWESLNKDHGKQIANKYQEEDVLIQDLSKEYDTSTYIIEKILDYHGVIRKSRSQIKRIGDLENKHRSYDLNHDYFKTWSHNMAYILGFIAADGCIYTNVEIQSDGRERERSRLTISLQLSDKELLEKIKKELQYEEEVHIYDLKTKDLRYASLSINSRTLINDIKKIGIKERKTFDLEIPPLLPKKYEIDFIRGFFDGDGSVGGQYPTNSRGIRTVTKQIRVRIACGSYNIVNDMQEILQNYGLKKKVINKSKNIFTIVYSTKESLLLYELFYRNPDAIYLKRKKDRFKELITTRKSQTE